MKRSIRIHGNVNVFDGRLGSGIHDKNGREIFEGDTLDVDFRALFKKYGLGDVNLDFDLADSECPADFDKKIFDALDPSRSPTMASSSCNSAAASSSPRGFSTAAPVLLANWARSLSSKTLSPFADNAAAH